MKEKKEKKLTYKDFDRAVFLHRTKQMSDYQFETFLKMRNKEQKNNTEKIIEIRKPYCYGKTQYSLFEFYKQCIEGKKTIYIHPKFEIWSPEYAKEKIKETRQQTLAEVIGWTERLDADGCDFVSTEKIREYILSLKQKYE